MSLYGRLFAWGYDRAMAGSERAGLGAHRDAVLGRATGRVLEIGAGTGVNLEHYPPALAALVLSDPEEPMLRRLRPRAAAATPRATTVRAEAERLPFDDGSFDTVVSTLTLCTVRDLAAALAEIRRVLVPGGRLLFLEHVRADDPRDARFQDRVAPLWRRLGYGCRPNRDTLRTLAAAGFVVRDVEHGRFPKGPRIVAPLVCGVAVRPS